MNKWCVLQVQYKMIHFVSLLTNFYLVLYSKFAQILVMQLTMIHYSYFSIFYNFINFLFFFPFFPNLAFSIFVYILLHTSHQNAREKHYLNTKSSIQSIYFTKITSKCFILQPELMLLRVYSPYMIKIMIHKRWFILFLKFI